MTYVGAVLSTMGGSTCVTSLILAPAAIPLLNGQLQTVCQRAQTCCRTGCHHRPCKPSPPDEVLPSHPHPMLGGASYANYNPCHIGASDPTLLLSDVVTSDLLNDILYSHPPTLYLQWQGTSIFGRRDRPSILCWWPESTTMELLMTQAPTLLCWPTSWPPGSPPTGAPSLQVATLALRT